MTDTASRATQRTRVAILGGGCGGLAAAWKLTSTAALREQFDVSVYQLGWQLGGKGASGRRPHGNGGVEDGQRIEEHGLHIWFGFYDHAFRMLRQAYEETELAAGDDWWKVPFEKCNSVSLYEQRDDHTWVRQSVDLPSRGGQDRGPPTEPSLAPLTRVIARTTRLLATGLHAELASAGPRRGGSAADAGDALSSVVSSLDQIAGEMDRAETPLTLDDEPARPITRGRDRLGGRPLRAVRKATVNPMLDRLRRSVGELQSQYADTAMSHRARLWYGVLELLTASLAGIVGDDVVWRGFGTLDEEDLRDWLRRHGASDATLERSPVLRGLYDLTFSYRNGDKRRPSLAAGKGLQALLMMINYEGAFMWRMRAGMGDVVFAPLYLGLKQRGVRFHFFSRVTRLRLMPGRPVVNAIEFVREANVTAGATGYDPLIAIGRWWCWPSAPDRSQLSELEPRAETLTRGSDFDEVVLAIPVGALDDVCSELAQANRRFKQMLDGAQTVRTKALQVWLTKPLAALRGQSGEELDPPATGYAEPFDTYCDMSHLLEAEEYGGGAAPKGVAYFCSVLPDDIDGSPPETAVRAAAEEYLERHARVIWPGAFGDGRFDWNVVFDPAARVGADRLGAQYVRANVAPTDRYVTTPAGSVDSRLDPDESGFENLVLAGDWTHSGIDGGCVEAAVISGERAAEALVTRRAGSTQAPNRSRRYVDYGALATAPGPLICERARLYCFFVRTDHARVQHLCDRVLKHPTGGELRYRVPRLTPVVLTFGTIAGLRSLHREHAGRGSASEPEAAIWVPTIGQRLEDGRYVDDHLAIFMPYIWVDDPVAFASGREVYGFAKTQGWMRRLGDPRSPNGERSEPARPPNPPEELALDVYGAAEYGSGAELGRERLITIRRSAGVRRGAAAGPTGEEEAEGVDISTLVGHLLSELEPGADLDLGVRRRSGVRSRPFASARSRAATLGELLTEQVTRLVFLKQIRDAAHGELAALQQVVEARSSVTPGSLRWRRLWGTYELSVRSLASHPLEDELGLSPEQTIKLAFAAEFGFRMEPGDVRWP